MALPYQVRESTLHRPDHTSLLVRHWQPAGSNVKANLLVLHGYLEHAGRYAPLAEYLAQLAIATHVYDMRGHGRSSGQRGYVKHFDDYLDDADAIVGTVESDAPLFVLGHSNGGLIALDWVMSRPTPAQGLIVTNPFLAMTSPPRGPKLWVGRLAGRFAPRLSLPSGLKSEQMSHDPQMVEAHRQDPLICHNANASWFRAVAKTQARVLGQRRVSKPLLYVYSGADPIAAPDINRQFAQQLDSPDKTIEERADEFHEVLNETKREALFAMIGKWILERSVGKHAPKQ